MIEQHYPFKPIPLPYSYDALEPYISEEVLRIHYEQHYESYVRKLNKSLRGYPNYWCFGLYCLLYEYACIPSDVRCSFLRNGGGVYNHEIYFLGMSPCKTEISFDLRKQIELQFGTVEKCGQAIFDAATAVFGSGYAGLASDSRGCLKIISFENQDTSYLQKYVPLLLVDVWEHAYYLQYKSDRAAYVKAWLNLVNWDFAAMQYEKRRKL